MTLLSLESMKYITSTLLNLVLIHRFNFKKQNYPRIFEGGIVMTEAKLLALWAFGKNFNKVFTGFIPFIVDTFCQNYLSQSSIWVLILRQTF